jgi:hypothetical protein
LKKLRQIIPTHSHFEGTVPGDIRLQVFFMNQFPQAAEYPITLFQIFWKIHQDSEQLQVLMEKIFNQKSFTYFVWSPLGYVYS